MKPWVVISLEKALNHYLALDPESKPRLQALAGKVVSIELLKVGVTFQLIFTGDGIQLKIPPAPLFQRGDSLSASSLKEEHDPRTPPLEKGGRGDFPDTIIKGTPFRLLHLSLSRENRQRFFADDVSILGNIELGQQVIGLFDHLDIDWEEHASRLMGDVPAHYLGNMGRRLKKWSQTVRQTTLQNVNEYVHEEANLFPPREALQDFFDDVDVLRMDVDRVEARIQNLQKMLKRSEL
jgi:ubiquinone biosynthesis protein UbiJ